MPRQRTVPHRTTGALLGTLCVEVVAGPDKGLRHAAERDTITVGTAEGNDVVLHDETVSRYHLELSVKDGRIRVEDHGSTNGTHHGTAAIERGTIAPGTTLALGRTQLRVEPGEPRAAELYEAERFGEVIARSPVMLQLLAQIERAAKSEASILLLGETGSGKEVLARAIHAESRRREAPFETVDCGSLLPALIASELFGHEKGAFTGADRMHVGAFERADGGTLFLDEIGELPNELQPALLGALERKSFRRVGGQKAIAVDVRVVCATNRELRAEVNAGRFRQDLYFRIAVVALRIPPLRERPEDVEGLLEHFLRENGYEGALEAMFPEAALEALLAHHWPGNVRELRNFVDAALALGETPSLAGPREHAASSGAELDALLDRPYGDAKNTLLHTFETRYLRHLMASCAGNVTNAARKAHMNRSHLLELVKRHGLK